MGNYNTTTGTYDLQPISIAYGCTQPYFLVRQAFQRRTAMYRYDEFRRPLYWEIDMNFAKTTRITDRVRFQFRVEAFNLLNSPMYDERRYPTGRHQRGLRADQPKHHDPVELPACDSARV